MIKAIFIAMRAGHKSIIRQAYAVILVCLAAFAVPASAAPTGEAAEMLIAAGKFEQAIDLLTPDLKMPAERRLYLLACAYLGEQNWRLGLSSARQARHLLPRDIDVQLVYMKALRVKLATVNPVWAMLSLTKYKAAIARALELAPDNVRARSEEIGFLTYAPRIVGGNTKLAQQRIEQLELIDFRKAMQLQIRLSRALHDEEGVRLAQQRLAANATPGEEAPLHLVNLTRSSPGAPKP